MIYDEIWSYPSDRIEAYLLEEGAINKGAVFSAADCTIQLEALPARQVGTLTLPRTRVQMKGTGAESFHHRFLLHFLSGGA